MAYTTIKKPSDYFNTVTYTGNGSTQSITGVGFQPDWVFLKPRSQSGQHGLSIDSVRGNTKVVFPNLTNAEQTITNIITAFGSDGFSLGNNAGANNNTSTYVAWNWLANGTGVSNTDGSITSTVSANTTSGFSIVSWVATDTVGTIGHGLGVAPRMIIAKNRTSAYHWQIGHSSIGWTNQLRFTNGASFASTQWNSTAPTSSVFSVPADYDINKEAGNNSIAYCFAEVKGFSKFGSYTGNGSTDGTFVYTGFKPAFVMTKNTSSAHDWWIVDNKRDIDNPTDQRLRANVSDAEDGSKNSHDFLSNGFKIRTTSGDLNESGQEIIYMAFAEEPLVGDNPATAR